MTSCGLNDGPLPACHTWDAYTACNLMSAEGAAPYQMFGSLSEIHPYFTQEDEEAPYQYIANMRDGSCAGFKYFDFSGMESTFTLCYRSSYEGRIEIGTSIRGSELAVLTLAPSDGWSTVTASMQKVTGIYPIYITFYGEKAADIRSFTIG